jgi:putative FmdB family regulatory protein
VFIKVATMPTYEYVCAKCGHEFEKFQPIADKPLAVCPKDLCAKRKWGKGKVKRKISTGGGLIFKGSGFYITDYRSDNYKESAKKDSAAAKPAGGESKPSGGDSKPSGGETKPSGGESKPAAKPESKPAESKPAKSPAKK